MLSPSLKIFIVPVFVALFCSPFLFGQTDSFIKGKKYQIDSIEVLGLKTYNAKTVISYTGLKKGQLVPLPGEEINLFSSSKLKISPSICYEIAFDNIVRKTAFDSNILITVSNDTWFGRSIGPDQHLEIAQNRALEHKKPLLRSTNSGISAIVSKDGQVIEKQGYFEEKNIKNNIVLYSGNTIYSRYGNFPIIILIVFYIGFLSIKSLLRIK